MPSHPSSFTSAGACATLVLASRSARRAALLREAGYAFVQADPPFDDPPQPEACARRGPAELARDLALQKTLSLRHAELPPDTLVLAADTICVGAVGQLIGQPATRAEARAMLQHFINQRHQVVTGVALLPLRTGEPTAFSDTATVTLGHLSDDALNDYLDTHQWQGKAGGYNLFDREAVGWPITVQGDRTTVVGLPMRRLIDALREYGIEPANKERGNRGLRSPLPFPGAGEG